MKIVDGGFALKGWNLYIGLAILVLLAGILGLLAVTLKHQKDVELARVKESLCREMLNQAPDIRISPDGNRLSSDDLQSLKSGDFVVIYKSSLPKKKWPGDFFQELVSLSEQGQLAFTVNVISVNSDSVTVKSDCFPESFNVPFSNLYNLFVSPFY